MDFIYEGCPEWRKTYDLIFSTDWYHGTFKMQF
uniref:Uncharacterized protein n=1 Tax=Arundo donax TaxID=35708 RepID=A0A0A8YV05_ARUDO